MKVNKWVAVLATCSVITLAAPVSAQFGGLGSLKKKLETVAKELEKPKPAPQPQPTARPTPPQSRPATSQGGYASPAPVRTQQVTAPPAPVVRQAVTNEVVATEAWRCFQEPDATAIKIEFSYLKDPTGQRRGFFKETYASAYDDEGNKLPADTERLGGKGTFTSRGANYQLRFEDPERGVINMAVGSEDPENGFVYSTTRYDSEDPSLDDIKSLVQKFSDAEIKRFEEFSSSDEGSGFDGGIPLRCALVKPIFSKYSFEDFSVQSPANYERYMGDKAKPKIAKEERDYRTNRYLEEAVENQEPDFGKFYVTATTYIGGAPFYALIDVRSGDVFQDFIVNHDDFITYANSNLVIGISSDDNNNSCVINYSTWSKNVLKLLDSDKVGDLDLCRRETPNEYGSFVKEDFLQLIEDQIIRGERRMPAKTAATASVPVHASASKAPVNAQIVSAEVWNCFSDVSPKPIRFELNYTSTQKKNERGSFREISPFDNEGNEAPTPNVSSGSFRYEQTQNGDVLKLEYADQSKEYRSFTSSVLDDGARFGEMDNLQCELVK